MVYIIDHYKKIKNQIDKNLIQCIGSGRLVNRSITYKIINNLSKYFA